MEANIRSPFDAPEQTGFQPMEQIPQGRSYARQSRSPSPGSIRVSRFLASCCVVIVGILPQWCSSLKPLLCVQSCSSFSPFLPGGFRCHHANVSLFFLRFRAGCSWIAVHASRPGWVGLLLRQLVLGRTGPSAAPVLLMLRLNLLSCCVSVSLQPLAGDYPASRPTIACGTALPC